MKNTTEKIGTISFFSFPPLEHGGGAEQYFIKTSKIVAELNPNVQVRVITSGDELFKRFLKILSVYYLKDVTKEGGYRENTEDVLKRLGPVEYIKCNSFSDFKHHFANTDVLYSRNELIDLLLLKIVSTMKTVPTIIAIHTPILYPYAKTFYSKFHNFLYKSILYKWLLKGAVMVKVSNSDDMQLVRDKYNIQSVRVVFHPVEITNYSERQSTNTLNVLFAARITEQKGIDILLKAISLLSNESFFKSIKFKIAGDGDEELVKTIKTAQAKYSNIQYLGFVKKEEIHSLFQEAQLVVAPSRYETVNQVVLEAGAHGCIVIATNIPGPRDIIVDGVTGHLIDVTPEALSSHIKQIYLMMVSDPKTFKEMQKKASKYVIKKFSAKSYDKAMWSIFEETYRVGKKLHK